MLYSLFLSILLSSFSSTAVQPVSYQCTPCGRDCDKAVYDKPGSCSDCHMDLVKKSGVSFRNMPPSMVCDYIKKHPGIVLLDVRTRDEFEGKADPDFGTLRQAINIPIQELDTRMKELARYKDREILVFCSHSHRSPRASYLLTQHGFTKVINMSGGMSEFGDKSCKK